MSVVAATAASVGPSTVPPPPVPYVLCGGVGGARKRKDVVQELKAEGYGGRDGDTGAHGLFVLETVEEEHEHEAEAEAETEAERERSSIGAVSGEEDEEEEEEEEEEVDSSKEAWSKKTKGGLTCLDALDDALPIKRGLSSFFSGKSRSFANLQDVQAGGARDVLSKPENPFNKRRRILRCSSIRRVSSTSLTALPPFLPPAGPGPSFNIGNDGIINGAGAGARGSG